MKFTIVTPNLNGMPFLESCVASIRMQVMPDIHVEHLVLDGGSTDCSCEYLATQPASLSGYSLRWMREADNGMYDAIDKGWRMATGDTLAWLNSDEQYLAGVLKRVAAKLAERPDAGLVYGGTLLIRPDGDLIAFRKAAPLRRLYLRASHLYVHSSSTFVRRVRVVEHDIMPDCSWRAAGDHDWMLRLLASGIISVRLSGYLSAFMMTGHNLGTSALSAGELRDLRRREPFWIRGFAPALRLCRVAEKYLAGGFREASPFSYEAMAADGKRINMTIDKPSWKWRVS